MTIASSSRPAARPSPLGATVQLGESSNRDATSVLDYFDRTYVINLPDRTDRRREMEVELQRAGMLDRGKVVFFPAIRVHELQGFPSLGARGCFLSHLSVLREAQRSGYRRILVMEDDLAISPYWERHQAAIARRLADDDWSLAYFGHAGVEDLPADAPSPICSYSGALYQTHFYGVRGECIEQLIAFLEAVLTREPGHPLGGPMHVDGAYHMFRMQHPDASTLIANPNLGTQRSSPSDVSPTWYDGVPVLKAAARIYRWAKRLRSGSGA